MVRRAGGGLEPRRLSALGSVRLVRPAAAGTDAARRSVSAELAFVRRAAGRRSHQFSLYPPVVGADAPACGAVRVRFGPRVGPLAVRIDSGRPGVRVRRLHRVDHLAADARRRDLAAADAVAVPSRGAGAGLGATARLCRAVRRLGGDVTAQRPPPGAVLLSAGVDRRDARDGLFRTSARVVRLEGAVDRIRLRGRCGVPGRGPATAACGGIRQPSLSLGERAGSGWAGGERSLFRSRANASLPGHLSGAGDAAADLPSEHVRGLDEPAAGALRRDHELARAVGAPVFAARAGGAQLRHGDLFAAARLDLCVCAACQHRPNAGVLGLRLSACGVSAGGARRRSAPGPERRNHRRLPLDSLGSDAAAGLLGGRLHLDFSPGAQRQA